jgi:protein-tyrosine phosphatase
MIKVLFICHGNICRSTMAQFVLQDMVNKAGLQDKFEIDSRATSREEIGNPPHRGTVMKMKEVGIPVLPHMATQITWEDYQRFDLVIGMDSWNMRNLLRMLRDDPDGKCHKLLEFAGSDRDIADPWYTGNFDETYDDVLEGCEALLSSIRVVMHDRL